MARAARPRGAQPAPADRITVRMYRVGFGDCFLIFIPHEGGLRKVLVDCGSIKRDPALNKGASDIAAQVVKDITGPGGTARIDLLIATHRHRDHVGGFAAQVWDKVDVGEVWLPWTESDSDEDARALRALQERVAARLAARLTANGKPGLAELAFNATSNAEALARLESGFKSRGRQKPRYLGAGEDDPRTLDTPHLPGVTIHVLGPPRDVEIIGRDLPADEDELFLRLGAGEALPAGTELVRPFDDDWIDENPSAMLEPRQIDRLKAAVAFDPEAMLSAIDDSLNNTSLVLVFELGGRFLMFAGDAQWGPWDAILKDEDAVALLRKVSFYKVSHHSSHNGTPVDFVNTLVGTEAAHPLSAMVSVTPHGSYHDIPRQPLIDALRTRFDHVAISDVAGDQPGFVRPTKWSIDFEFEPSR